MSETNEERLERLKVLAGNSDYFDDLKWVIEQAEQLQVMKKEFADDIDFKRREVHGLHEENKRLREAINHALEKHKWNNEESARILEQALEGTK